MGVPTPGADCSRDLDGYIKKTLALAIKSSVKVMSACHDGILDMGHPGGHAEQEASAACKTARAEAKEQEKSSQEDCIEQESADVCTLSGEDVKTEEVCLPQTCRNPIDLKALAKKGT